MPASHLTVTIRIAPWWMACFHDAMRRKDFGWALWLRDHVSVEVL